MTGSEFAAEEIVGEVFMLVWQKKNYFRALKTPTVLFLRLFIVKYNAWRQEKRSRQYDQGNGYSQ